MNKGKPVVHLTNNPPRVRCGLCDREIEPAAALWLADETYGFMASTGYPFAVTPLCEDCYDEIHFMDLRERLDNQTTHGVELRPRKRPKRTPACTRIPGLYRRG